jgi:hypothetical protein
MNFNSWIFKFWPLKNFEAITFPWGVYFKAPENLVNKSTIRHEQIHLEQRERLGVFIFYFLYLKEYVLNIFKFRNFDMAYRKISFEIEAYAKQDQDI